MRLLDGAASIPVFGTFRPVKRRWSINAAKVLSEDHLQFFCLACIVLGHRVPKLDLFFRDRLRAMALGDAQGEPQVLLKAVRQKLAGFRIGGQPGLIPQLVGLHCRLHCIRGGRRE